MNFLNTFAFFVFSLCCICIVCANSVSFTGVRDNARNGTCGKNGDNVNWTFDESSSTLTIQGSGEMMEYASKNLVPWYSFRSTINAVTFIGDITSLSPYVLYGTNINTVTIPSTVTKIGLYAFFECKELLELTIPSNVQTIGIAITANCVKLKKIKLADGNNHFSVNSDVLYSADGKTLLQYPCDKGSEFTVPDTVETIKDYAFYGATVKKVKIPHSVTSIGGSAFYLCLNLESINIPPQVTVIKGTTFLACSSIESFVVPASVTKIENRAFDSTKFKAFAFLGNSEPTIPSRIFPMSGNEFVVCVPSTYNGTKFSDQDVTKGGLCAAVDNANKCYVPDYNAKDKKWVLVKDEEAWKNASNKCEHVDPSKGAVHFEIPLLIMVLAFITSFISKY